MNTATKIVVSIALTVCFIILFLGMPVIVMVAYLTERPNYKLKDVTEAYKLFFDMVRECYVDDVWGEN